MASDLVKIIGNLSLERNDTIIAEVSMLYGTDIKSRKKESHADLYSVRVKPPVSKEVESCIIVLDLSQLSNLKEALRCDQFEDIEGKPVKAYYCSGRLANVEPR